jgi:hypothetical protein
MIRWTFYFAGEGTVKTDIIDDEREDERIAHFVTMATSKLFKGSRCLTIPAPLTNIYLNLDLVKCVTREILPDTAPAPTVSDALPNHDSPQAA